MLAATTMLSGCRQGLAKMRPAAGTQAPPDDLTVIITTSPTPSNPSLDCFEFLMETFQKVPPLVACRKIICCDGCKIIDGDRCYFRAGQVSEEALGLYSEYMDHLQDRVSLAATDPTDAFFNSELLRLDERHSGPDHLQRSRWCSTGRAWGGAVPPCGPATSSNEFD